MATKLSTLPIDDVRWTNCRKCGHRYADYVRHCPRCNGSTKSGAGKVAAVSGVVVAVVIILLAFNSNLIMLTNPFTQLQDITDNQSLTGQDNNDLKTDSDDRQGEVSQIEYVLETKTKVLVDSGAFLGPNDVRTFNIQIPNENVTTLEGTIIVDGSQYLHVEFTDAYGEKYCEVETRCSYDVYGEGSGKSTQNRNNRVSIPIDSGDALKLIVSNPESLPLQTVSVDLHVSYQALRERIIPATIEGEQQEDEPSIVPTFVEEKDDPVEPEHKEEPPEAVSSGIGRNVDPELLATRVHELINEKRKENGLAVLDWDGKLSNVAEKHSTDMAERDYFSHDTPEGKDPTARAEDAGYHCVKDYGSYYTIGVAENLFQHWTYDSITYINGIPMYHWNTLETLAQDVVEGWMDSAGHRQNILTQEYDREGIGVTIASNDKVYVTENFC